DFNTAVEHFDNAVRLDPSNVAPKLFLANALMREAFADKATSAPLMARARQQYIDVLAYEGGNKQALEGLVMTAMSEGQPREARDWAMKLIQADPKDKNGYYSVGVADWALAFPEVQRARMQ